MLATGEHTPWYRKFQCNYLSFYSSYWIWQWRHLTTSCLLYHTMVLYGNLKLNCNYTRSVLYCSHNWALFSPGNWTTQNILNLIHIHLAWPYYSLVCSHNCSGLLFGCVKFQHMPLIILSRQMLSCATFMIPSCCPPFGEGRRESWSCYYLAAD